MEKTTTIKLKSNTKKALALMGTKDDTYEDIVKRLMAFYKRNYPKSGRVEQ